MSICSGSCGRAVDIVHKDHAVLYKIEEYYFGYPIHLASAFGETKIVEHMYTAASMNGIGRSTVDCTLRNRIIHHLESEFTRCINNNYG